MADGPYLVGVIPHQGGYPRLERRRELEIFSVLLQERF